MARRRSRTAILGQIRNPLVFFALALLMIEGIIGAVVAKSGLTQGYLLASVALMAFLFLVVVGAVTWITIKWPQHLYEDVVKELQAARELKEFVESAAFRDTIEEVVIGRIKPQCLAGNDDAMGTQSDA